MKHSEDKPSTHSNSLDFVVDGDNGSDPRTPLGVFEHNNNRSVDVHMSRTNSLPSAPYASFCNTPIQAAWSFDHHPTDADSPTVNSACKPQKKRVPRKSVVHLGRVSGESIRIGLCCMKKKAKSATMQAMLARFEEMKVFEIVVFAEDIILNTPASEWPLVDVMIAFFSGGFPLGKAVEYRRLHPHIYYLTDPSSQQVLLDRRDFYSALSRNSVPVVRHVFCNRDGYKGLPDSKFEEGPDYIEVDGVRVNKPFVEKPADSEDHNVYIYYKGGGCTKLFRKVANQSSSFDPELSAVRKNGSFVYEDYIETSQMMDIKCYTVGPNFVHAEARKAPAQDGVVMRDESGKELRETVELSGAELMVARKVIKVFRQVVCGFDILRASDGGFYVCDVNGWSFVKNNAEYVERATSIMRDIFLEQVRQRGLHRAIRGKSVQRQLCGVVCVMRHADRTPKQKVKIRINVEPLLMAIFSGNLQVEKEVVLKSGNPKLKHIQTVVSHLLDTSYSCSSDDEQSSEPCKAECNGAVTFRDEEIEEMATTVPQLQELLTPKNNPANPPETFADEGNGTHTSPPLSPDLGATEAGPCLSSGSIGEASRANFNFNFKVRTADNVGKNVLHSMRLMKNVLDHQHEGLKIQIKPQQWGTDGVCTEALLVCKWGGWLTEAGEKQATAMGANLIDRIYNSEITRIPRSRLVVETNNERRVINTAIAVSRKLVNDPTIDDHFCTVNEDLLGSTQAAKACMEAFAADVKAILHTHDPADVERIQHLPGIPALLQCPVLPLNRRTPLGALQTIHEMLENLLHYLPTNPNTQLYRNESVELMTRRWDNLVTSFFQRKTNTYDTTKIPDIFDYVSYDVCYNQQVLAPYDMYPLFTLAETLSVFTSDGEFGLSVADKRQSACLFATPLLHRIHSDLSEMAKQASLSAPTGQPSSNEDDLAIQVNNTPLKKSMRLYVTSESHLMGLKNLLYYSSEDQFLRLEEPMEMHFLAHIVFKVYYYPSSTAKADDKYQVEVHFSPGVDKNMFGIVQEQHAEYASVTPMIRIHNNLKLSSLHHIVKEYEALQHESTDLEETPADD